MGSVYFACGCSITTSMYGEHEVLNVTHCSEHGHLFSQDKTLRQMAEEIRKACVEHVNG
jgi:hypothetical protein